MPPAYSCASQSSLSGARPDLDEAYQIDRMVQLFYRRLLADEQVAPWFRDVAQIHLAAHLPLISQYWQKMLLGDPRYRRHTMARHRHLHSLRPLQARQLDQWLRHFEQTLNEGFAGPNTERARQIARRVMTNLARQLNLAAPTAPKSGQVGDGEIGQ